MPSCRLVTRHVCGGVHSVMRVDRGARQQMNRPIVARPTAGGSARSHGRDGSGRDGIPRAELRGGAKAGYARVETPDPAPWCLSSRRSTDVNPLQDSLGVSTAIDAYGKHSDRAQAPIARSLGAVTARAAGQAERKGGSRTGPSSRLRVAFRPSVVLLLQQMSSARARCAPPGSD